MHCAKCGQENPDDAGFCNSCGCALTDNRPRVRVSRMAIASVACALLALGCFVPGLVATLDPWALDPKSDVVGSVACVSGLLAAVAFFLGIVALCLIGSSGGRLTGYGFAAIGAVIPPILIFVLFWFNVGGRWYATVHPRMVCGTNLMGLGKAMLIYSNDYDDEFPRAGGPDGRWSARLPWWAADNSRDAYGLSDPNATEGRASISSSLYLLVKYAGVTPKSFICKGDYRTTEFRPAKYGAGDRELTDLWDFGPEPWKHCSYSYHMPYGRYALTTSCGPGMAVAADRNPWMASPFVKAPKDFSKFNPDGDREAIKAGNAVAHNGDGQNVLFLDAHVGFEKRSFCGINDDNIYTYWDGEDIRKGKVPTLGSQPADSSDSLLVNDPAVTKH
jgi:predicted nucleic acid-binding Zn ribbon protein